MSIVTTLLHTNYKENLMTRFSAINKTDFKGLLYLIMLPWPWQWHTRQLNYQKTEVCAVNFLAAIFGNKGSRVLEKMVNETLVSNTVFSHLNPLM